MRYLLIFVVLIAVFLGAVWLGGESWLARRATTAIEQRDDVSAGMVTPLRQASRIGIRAEQVDYAGDTNGRDIALSLPWAELWVPPTALTDATLTLPDAARLSVDGREAALRLTGGQGMLRLSPLNNMALTRARMTADSVAIDDQPALEGLRVAADLVSLGHDAPRGARAAYNLSLQLESLDPAALVELGLPAPALPGAISADGDLHLWLTDAPGMKGLRGAGPQAQLVGFRSAGIDLGIGDLTARVIGQVAADAQGRAEGRMAIYTADAQELLAAAEQAGMIPRPAVSLGGAMLTALSRMPMTPEEDGDAAKPVRMVGSQPVATGFVFPDPAEGELRIPIFLRDGRVFLGAIPVGPAPKLLRGQPG